MGLFRKDRNLAVPPEHVELEVRASDYGLRAIELELRLDAFLKQRLSWRSRSSIQRLIRSGYVSVRRISPERPEARVDEVERRSARLLRHGDEVVVRIPEELRLPPVLEASPDLDVLYEDDEVLAVDKPAGVAVHPSGRHLADTLIQRVHALYRGTETAVGGPVIRLCHRLDKETSGIVLLAKSERAHAAIGGQFEARTVEKEYLAVVRGVPREDGGVIDAPIGPAHASAVRLKMTVTSSGLPSVTEWSVIERHTDCALVRCMPRTGRQHQIRVHLEALGHPIVGDKLYGTSDDVFLRGAAGELSPADHEELGLARHALHSSRLVWRSPATAERRESSAPLAADLRSYLDERRP